MKWVSWCLVAASLGAGLAAMDRPAVGENLGDAWNIALRVNAGLQSQQELTTAQGLNLRAARASRLPTVRPFTFNSLLTVTPGVRTSSFLGSSAAGRGSAGAGGTGTGSGGGGTGTGAGSASLFPRCCRSSALVNATCLSR